MDHQTTTDTHQSHHTAVPTAVQPANGPAGMGYDTSHQSYYPQAVAWAPAQPPSSTSKLWIAYHVIDLVVKIVGTAMLVGILIALVLQYNLLYELMNDSRRWFPVRVTMDYLQGTTTTPFYVKMES